MLVGQWPLVDWQVVVWAVLDISVEYARIKSDKPGRFYRLKAAMASAIAVQRWSAPRLLGVQTDA